MSTKSFNGVVYVVQRSDQFKIGFSRGRVKRRARDAGGQLLFTIPAGNQPSVLEGLIHQRFKAQLIPEHGREWFSLSDQDIAWLRGLAEHMAEHVSAA